MFVDSMYQLGSKRSCIRELFEYGQQKARELGPEHVFDYSLGNPSVPVPAEAGKVIEELVETEDTLVLHGYTSASGSLDTRAAVADDLNVRYHAGVRPENLFMTCGAAPALVSILRALAIPGAEILLLTPFFPEYVPFSEANGAKPVIVPAEEGFRLNAQSVERYVTPHTQAIIVNSPNNPSGVVYTREELEALAEMLRRKEAEYGHPIYIIADEPYRELAYGVEVPFLPAIYPNAIYCYSYSKTLSLPGERVGFLALHPAMDDYAAVHAAVLGAGRALGYICVSSLFQLAVARRRTSRPMRPTANLSTARSRTWAMRARGRTARFISSSSRRSRTPGRFAAARWTMTFCSCRATISAAPAMRAWPTAWRAASSSARSRRSGSWPRATA